MSGLLSIPAPHSRPRTSVPRLMRRVLYALIPAACCHVWYFGPGLLVNFLVCALAGLAAEALVLRLRHRPAGAALGDGSALVTAALLAFTIPPLVPWWVPASGAAMAIVVAKQLYGGLGRNLFNPAMVGYAFLLLSFPVEMTQWVPPRIGDLDYAQLSLLQYLSFTFTGDLPAGLSLDGLTRATPLDLIREGVRASVPVSEVRASALFGSFGGRGWEWIANFVALGGLYLIYTRSIRWHIPTAVLAGLLVPATVLNLVDATTYASPALHLFSGATMLGAFFIATDPVSAAATVPGRLIFGAGIGMLTYAIRTWGGYPDGLAFAVLLMNAAVPLIDRYTRPTPYGHA